MSCCGAVSAESIVSKYPNSGKGKTAIVTGANTGIGKTTAQALAAVGFNVVIAGRTIEALETAKKHIDSEIAKKHTDETIGLKHGGDGGRVTVLKTPLDLSSVASIKAFAADFLEQKLPLHVLINNAGVVGFPGKTKDGLDYTMGVNWFGGFLLTNLLLEVLKASTPSRVIIVSSSVHDRGRITVENIDKLVKSSTAEGLSSFMQTYSDSKLANILHAKALTKRLTDTGVSVFSLHPGAVQTGASRNLPCCMKCILSCCSCCLKNPSEGAATSVQCAIADGLVSGGYYADCRLTKPNNSALNDDKVSEALWTTGEELTKKLAN